MDLALRNDATSGSLLLSWRDGALGGTSLPPATHYSVSVNDMVLTNVEVSEVSDAGEEGVCSVMLSKELLEPVVGERAGEWHFVTVRALHNGLESRESDKVRISPLMLKKVFASQGAEDMVTTHAQQNGHSPKMADKGGAKSLLDYAAEDDSEDDLEDTEEGRLPQGPVGAAGNAMWHGAVRQPVANVLDLAGSEDEESASEGEGQPARSRQAVSNLMETAGDEYGEDVSSGEVEAGVCASIHARACVCMHACARVCLWVFVGGACTCVRVRACARVFTTPTLPCSDVPTAQILPRSQ